MDERDCHRQEIAAASEYVRVRREDLEWIVSLTDRKSRDAKYSPKFLRLAAALETSCPDQ
jgi:hypothetical protein